MNHENIWKAAKTASLITWLVMLSFGLAIFLDTSGIVDLRINFRPNLLTYFFVTLYSSLFAVSYVKFRQHSSQEDSVREALIGF